MHSWEEGRACIRDADEEEEDEEEGSGMKGRGEGAHRECTRGVEHMHVYTYT